jgi:hypothetical protein
MLLMVAMRSGLLLRAFPDDVARKIPRVTDKLLLERTKSMQRTR